MVQPLRFIDANSDDAPIAVRSLLRRRRPYSSAYRFDIAAFVDHFHAMLLEIGPLINQPVNFVTICSLERSNATLRSSGGATIVLDIGFLEVLSDYLIVAAGLHDRVPLALEDQFCWGKATMVMPQAKRDDIRKRVRQSQGQAWEFEIPAIDANDAGDDDPDEPREPSITGSQMFRDIAAKLMETGWQGSYNREVFEAFCLWTTQIGGRNYRPGPLLANHILHGTTVDPAHRQFYALSMTTAVQQILCHEYAHCMFDRSATERWRQTDEYDDITRELRTVCGAQRKTGAGEVSPDWSTLLDPPEMQSARTRRAMSESFFDIRALHMMIRADRVPLSDPEFITGYFGVLFDVSAKNIAVMAMRDAMAEAMRGHSSMDAMIDEALAEVRQRCIMLHCALVRLFLNQFNDGDTGRFYDLFSTSIQQIHMLAHFFMIDITNNLPTLQYEDETPQSYAERGWNLLIEAIKAPSAP